MKDTYQQHRDERDAQASKLAAQMPDDRAGIIAEAQAAIDALNDAVLASDGEAAEAAESRYEAAVWKLNGRTFFGSMAGPESGGIIAREACSAAPGTVPKWGQSGEFVATVDGMRALVSVTDGFSVRRAHFEFRAVDLDRPFISETGYRSHVAAPCGGVTVREAVEATLAAMIRKGVHMVGDEYRVRRADDARPWLGQFAEQPIEAFADATGQLAFAF
ncbi:hypothetical protein WT34_24455 [Burkholderia stagnalis]|uniref:hypothetical protein n=1 Tax=Burkholderia stagnalis TaxID=1503054 RepID=UPI00075E2890|nr:hypothetical protein [Burkholderia stagnalis]KVX69129.1 hypothetical protein WT34_24455 [Burkholderia stagnalis]